MAYQDVILEKDKGVAILTLNRPDRLNAVSMTMRRELVKALEEVRLDDEVRALIVTGAGRGFCSGADVTMQAARAEGQKFEENRTERLEPLGSFTTALRDLEKPTIAAVNGVAAGIGLTLAMACDIKIASDQARFSAIWVRRGLIPDGGGTYLMARLIRLDRAMELMYTGDIIDAKEADKLGLVTRVVPAADLMKAAKELAGKIAKGPPIAQALMKRAVLRSFSNDWAHQLDYESYAQNLCHTTEDHREGVKSFLEKRESSFQGR